MKRLVFSKPHRQVTSGAHMCSTGLVGATSTGGGDFGLARYKLNGTLDPSFGTRGKVMTDFAGADDAADALALQSNGKIVVAGGTRRYFALARYL
jgi:hypothetical protein